MKGYFLFFISIFGVFLFVSPSFVFAHKVKIFAAVEGRNISGYAYYTSSSRPKNVKINLYGPDGKLIEELTTNEQGEFHSEARYRADTRVQLLSADGHSAEWLISKEEFPADLPKYPGAGEGMAEKDVKEGQEQASVAETIARNSGPVIIDGENFTSLIRGELAPLQKQLGQLRAELAEQQEKKQLQDILGGIGYLIGLAGIASYIAARRRKGH